MFQLRNTHTHTHTHTHVHRQTQNTHTHTRIYIYVYMYIQPVYMHVTIFNPAIWNFETSKQKHLLKLSRLRSTAPISKDPLGPCVTGYMQASIRWKTGQPSENVRAVDGTGVCMNAQNNQKNHLGSESSLSFLQLLNHILDFNWRSFSIMLNLSSMGKAVEEWCQYHCFLGLMWTRVRGTKH
jgi:hypothetical protein